MPKQTVVAKTKRRVIRVDTSELPATQGYVKAVVSKTHPTDTYDTSPSSAASVNSTGTFTALAPIPQGDGSEQRPGNKVRIIGLRYHGLYKSDTLSAATSIHILRAVIFRWLPDNNVDAPSLAKLFKDTGDNQSMFIDDRNLRKKFQIIKDYHRVFNSVNNGNGMPLSHIKRKFIKVNRTLSYNDEAITGKGQIYLLEWGNAASGNEDITGNSKVRVLYKKYA